MDDPDWQRSRVVVQDVGVLEYLLHDVAKIPTLLECFRTAASDALVAIQGATVGIQLNPRINLL